MTQHPEEPQERERLAKMCEERAEVMEGWGTHYQGIVTRYSVPGHQGQHGYSADEIVAFNRKCAGESAIQARDWRTITTIVRGTVSGEERVRDPFDYSPALRAALECVRGFVEAHAEEHPHGGGPALAALDVLAAAPGEDGERNDIISLREQASAWEEVWELCENLGMDTDELSGEADVLAFIRSLYARAIAAETRIEEEK